MISRQCEAENIINCCLENGVPVCWAVVCGSRWVEPMLLIKRRKERGYDIIHYYR